MHSTRGDGGDKHEFFCGSNMIKAKKNYSLLSDPKLPPSSQKSYSSSLRNYVFSRLFFLASNAF